MKFLKIFFTDIYIDIALFIGLWVYAVLSWEMSEYYVLGAIVSLVSIIFWIISRVQLGKSFEVLPTAKPLKTHGIYSIMKHPIYIFSTISYLGLFIATENLYIGIIFVCVVIVQAVRAKRENKLLKENFAEYNKYSKEVWF